MPDRCVVFGCSNQANLDANISVHRIPYMGDNRPEASRRRALWVDFVKSTRACWEPTVASAICSVHFTPDSYRHRFFYLLGQENPIHPTLNRDEYGVVAYPTIYDPPVTPPPHPPVPKVHKKGKKSKMMPKIPEVLKRDYLGIPKRYKLSTFNPFITCPICQGYLVDPTTITECLHSFCRSCIVKHLEKNFHCPLCNELVHKTNPWYNLRSDTALHDIVIKLIPGFTKAEERRRRVFYRSRGLPVPEKVIKPDPPVIYEPVPSPVDEHEQSPPPPPLPPPPRTTTMYHEGDQVTMQLEMKCADEFTEGNLLPLKRKFVRCSAHVTIGLLQKFIARKLRLDAANQIEILCCDMELGSDFTLHYIKETIAAVEDHGKPLLLHYGLTQLEL